MNEQIIIAMKPLDKNFVSNALEHDVAGINIDGSRIKTSDGLGGGGETGAVAAHAGFQRPWMKDEQKLKEHAEKVKSNVKKAENLGRWPSNIILQHHPECVKVGAKKVKGITGGGRKKSPVRKGGVHTDYKGHQTVGREQSYVDYADDEGNETIENWNCHPDCPIRIMDEQSGMLSQAGNIRDSNIPASPTFKIGKVTKNPKYYDDSGGASRFFYQVKNIDESTIKEETSMKVNTLHNEDCKETMKKMKENSLPFIITDPPYLLEFMGKEFDKQHHLHEGENTGQKMQKWHTEWLIEAYRVLQPGGFLVAFGGTRTYHRLACAMEDVGFEIRDTMQWIYGSGFPKSLDISKAIDKRKGAEREIVGKKDCGYGATISKIRVEQGYRKNLTKSIREVDITTPTTDEAKKWEGWGTALKPAYEPIVIGMKSVSGSFVDNALNEGVAGINIDDSRVATNPKVDDMLRITIRQERKSGQLWKEGSGFKNENNDYSGVREDGRFPANVILQHHDECKKIGTKKIKVHKGYVGEQNEMPGSGRTMSKGWHGKRIIVAHSDKDGNETVEDYECHKDCPVRIMNEQSGDVGGDTRKTKSSYDKGFWGTCDIPQELTSLYNDHGGASRFFYTAKASKSERNVGLEGLPLGESPGSKRSKPADGRKNALGKPQENYHPTVKPIDLMRYLVNMFSTPDGGVVYDPFVGSGTTLIACKILGREYIGSEMDPEYYEIAKKRLQYDWVTWWARGKKDDFVKVKEEVKNKFFE